MVVLSVLGLAIGLSSVDANDRAANYGLGVGIWGGISALIAFFLGGWMAGWTKPTGYTSNGLAQGAVMWMLAIVLLVYLVAGGVGSIMNAAASTAATSAQIAGQAASATANAAANDPQVRNDVMATTQQATQDIRAKADKLYQKATPQNVEKAAGMAAGGAWGTLASLLLTMVAAVAGGHFGSSMNRNVVSI